MLSLSLLLMAGLLADTVIYSIIGFRATEQFDACRNEYVHGILHQFISVNRGKTKQSLCIIFPHSDSITQCGTFFSSSSSFRNKQALYHVWKYSGSRGSSSLQDLKSFPKKCPKEVLTGK